MPIQEELIQKIRMLLGNVNDQVLPDDVIEMFLETWETYYNYPADPSKLPLIIYNTVVSCLQWLLVNDVTSGNSSLNERLEKIGDETISIKQQNSSSIFKNWQDMLDYILDNPQYVDPTLNGAARVIIGGTRRDQSCTIKRDRNGLNGYDVTGMVNNACQGRKCCGFGWGYGYGGRYWR